jgi:hypothetical protein
MALTRLNGINAITGTIPQGNIANASLGAVTALPTGLGGKVLQVLNATDSTSRTTTSTSPVTASNTLSVTLTPSSSSNKVFVIANFNLHQTSNETYSIATIYRGSTNIGNSNGGMGRIWSSNTSKPVHPMTISVLDSPATTSATTYQVYIWLSGSGTTYFNGLDNNAQASITAFEIAV